MAHRKTLIQVKYRLRQDILRKLTSEAKRHDRSVNDEIARRLEDSFTFGRDRWRQDRDQRREERLLLLTIIKSHSNLTTEEKEIVDKSELADAEDARELDWPDVVKTTQGE
jgi:hypothetical protein